MKIEIDTSQWFSRDFGWAPRDLRFWLLAIWKVARGIVPAIRLERNSFLEEEAFGLAFHAEPTMTWDRIKGFMVGDRPVSEEEILSDPHWAAFVQRRDSALSLRAANQRYH